MIMNDIKKLLGTSRARLIIQVTTVLIIYVLISIIVGPRVAIIPAVAVAFLIGIRVKGNHIPSTPAKRNWWSMKPRGRGMAASIFSGIDEMFQGSAKQAQVTRDEQKRRVFEVGNSDDLKKIIIRLPKE